MVQSAALKVVTGRLNKPRWGRNASGGTASVPVWYRYHGFFVQTDERACARPVMAGGPLAPHPCGRPGPLAPVATSAPRREA
jgi:hypothetical protein